MSVRRSGLSKAWFQKQFMKLITFVEYQLHLYSLYHCCSFFFRNSRASRAWGTTSGYTQEKGLSSANSARWTLPVHPTSSDTDACTQEKSPSCAGSAERTSHEGTSSRTTYDDTRQRTSSTKSESRSTTLRMVLPKPRQKAAWRQLMPPRKSWPQSRTTRPQTLRRCLLPRGHVVDLPKILKHTLSTSKRWVRSLPCLCPRVKAICHTCSESQALGSVYFDP